MLSLILSLADILFSLFHPRRQNDDDDVAIFDLPRDLYNGVTLDSAIPEAAQLNENAFRVKLKKSLEIWASTEVRAVTIYVRLPQAHFIPVCTSLGFEFHHARADFVFLIKWLPVDRPSKFPSYGNTFVGVGGLVVNENEEILVVQERYIGRPHWKLPGGLSEQGEDIDTTAIREVLEETGIETSFVCVLAFRHMHGYHFGCSDFYFVCLLRPTRRGLGNDDLVPEESEIAQCQWMPITEYLTSPLVSVANRFIAERYLNIRDSQRSQGQNQQQQQQLVLEQQQPPIPNGIEPSLAEQRSNQLPNHFHVNDGYEDDFDDTRDPLRPLPRLPVPPPPEEPSYAITQTPVPSYDGRTFNMCYSVERLDLNTL